MAITVNFPTNSPYSVQDFIGIIDFLTTVHDSRHNAPQFLA